MTKQVKVNEKIINLITGKYFLVVGVNGMGVMATDMMDKNDPAQIYMIFPRDWDHWEKEKSVTIDEMAEGMVKYI